MCSRRSLAAAEQLSKAGYSTLAWINGGLDTSRKGDLPAVDDTDLRYGGIGGLTEVFGLTDVQRDANPNSKNRGSLFIKVVRCLPCLVLRLRLPCVVLLDQRSLLLGHSSSAA